MALRRADLGEFAEDNRSLSSAVSFGGSSSTARRSALQSLKACSLGASIGPSNNLSPHRGLSILDRHFPPREEFSITSPFQSTIQVLARLAS
jgi:hypothetical protein